MKYWQYSKIKTCTVRIFLKKKRRLIYFQKIFTKHMMIGRLIKGELKQMN